MLITNNNKIINGLGNTTSPEYSYQTPFEAAKKSNIDSLYTKTGEQDRIIFQEKNCLAGSIGTIYRKQLMFLVPAYAFELDKYSA